MYLLCRKLSLLSSNCTLLVLLRWKHRVSCKFISVCYLCHLDEAKDYHWSLILEIRGLYGTDLVMLLSLLLYTAGLIQMAFLYFKEINKNFRIICFYREKLFVSTTQLLFKRPEFATSYFTVILIVVVRDQPAGGDNWCLWDVRMCHAHCHPVIIFSASPKTLLS